MSQAVNVARYHLVARRTYVALPWGFLTFLFTVNLVISGAESSGPNPTKSIVGFYLVLFVGGVLSIGRSLPFGLSLGVSRRTYLAGTLLLGSALAVVYGLALTVLQAIERATGGWGVSLRFFRVSYILSGPWDRTWLTSSVIIALLFVYGMWFGLVYLRWNLTGLLGFIAGQILVLLAATLVVAASHAWHGVGHFFTALTATGLTGVLAAVTAVLIAGALLTIRRVTI